LQNKTAHDLQDVTLAWNVGPAHARRLHQMDIHTLNDLSKTDFTILKSIKGLGVKKIPQILNSARAQLNREVIRTGRFLLSEEKPKNEIYLDLEGTGELFQDDPGWNCIYLIGLIQIKEGKEFPYRPFLAVQPGDEKGIIREFFDFLDSLEGEYRLYHWDHYERTQLRKASERYGFIEEFNRLIFPQLDDLCRAAQESFVLPTPGYSIKVVAPFFGFHWAQSSSEVDAMKSAMIWYKQAVEGGTRAGLEKVVRYNEDDCRAMIEIKEGFRLLDAGGDVKKG
ncbi:MAG TPA: TM0106 family RecB-like putative nuclease, partial [Nitrospiria bacterium]